MKILVMKRRHHNLPLQAKLRSQYIENDKDRLHII